MENEIKKEDMEELQGFVDCGLTGIRLAKMSYIVGRCSVHMEDIKKSAESIRQLNQHMNQTATSTPAGVGKVNGSDIDTTTPLPESSEDEHPAACNDKCGDKADSRSLPQVRLSFENHEWVVRNLDGSLFCCHIPRYRNDACDDRCINYSETLDHSHILCKGTTVAEIIEKEKDDRKEQS